MHLLHHHAELATIAQAMAERRWGGRVQLHTDPQEVVHLPEFAILEPVRFEQTYLSIFALWVDYFQTQISQGPGPRMLRLGLAPAGHGYELDLFQLPDRPFSPVVNAVCTLPRQPICDTYHLNGLDLRWFLRRFLQGHGGELFFEPFEQVRRKLAMVDQLLDEGRPYGAVRDHYLGRMTPAMIQRFLQRWQQYQGYFAFLPPAWQLAPHQSFLTDLQAFLAGEQSLEQWNHSQLGTRIHAIFTILEQLRDLYVTSPSNDPKTNPGNR